MSLYDVSLMTNKQLVAAFLEQTKLFMDGICDSTIKYNTLQDIRTHLRTLSTEMDKRRKEGTMEDLDFIFL